MASAPTTHRLNPEDELRFEAKEGGLLLKVEAQQGAHAECFGAEIPPGTVVSLPAYFKGAIFTWHGCTVLLEGEETHYTQAFERGQSPMQNYLLAHAALEEQRARARQQNIWGPRVMVCGAPNSGKNSVCKILANYAARKGSEAILVDCDPTQNMITMPGSISAVNVSSQLNLADPFTLLPPVAYWVGHTTPEGVLNATELYIESIRSLAKVVRGRQEKFDATRWGGLVINTPASNTDQMSDLMIHVVNEFHVDIILVLGDARLTAYLTKHFTRLGAGQPIVLNVHNDPISITKLPKSEGVLVRDPAAMRDYREMRIREYFYGIKAQATWKLQPQRKELRFEDVEIYEVKEINLPQSLLPIGVEQSSQKLSVERVDPTPEYKDKIMAVYDVTNPSDVVSSCVRGFLHVQAVDVAQRIIAVHLPTPGPMPGNVLVVGSVSWVDRT